MSATFPYMITAPKNDGGQYRLFAKTIEEAGDIIERFGGDLTRDNFGDSGVCLWKDTTRSNAFRPVEHFVE